MPEGKPAAWACLAVILLLPGIGAASGKGVAGTPICQSNCQENEAAAHLAAARRYQQLAQQQRREYAWNVCRVADGTYSYTLPERSPPDSEQGRTPPVHADCEATSSGHVHWNDRLEFSGLDWLWVAANREPLYLVNRAGELRRLDVRRVLSLRRNGRYSRPVPDATYPGHLVAQLAGEPAGRAIAKRVESEAMNTIR